MTLKFGFIGVGFIAQQCHLPAFASNNGACIHAVSDLHFDLAKKIGRRFEVEKVYESHNELLKDNDIDCVVVTLPRRMTANVVSEALKAGKNVFTEKPLALNLGTGSHLVELALANNKVLYVGYMKHFDNGYLQLLSQVEERKVKGKAPLFIRSNCYMGDSYANPFGDYKSKNTDRLSISELEEMPAWLGSELEVGYENHLNVFSHVIGLLSELTNSRLEVVTARIGSAGEGISIFDGGGIPVEMSTAKCSINGWQEKIEVVFDDEILVLEMPPALLKNVPGSLTIISGERDHSVATIRPAWSWSFLNQAEHFISICTNDSKNAGNGARAVENIRIVTDMFRMKAAEQTPS